MPVTFPGTPADRLVCCVYVLWLAVTIGGVLRCKNLSPGIVSTFAPTWPLFAPSPINYDYDLAFRAQHGEGRFSPWQLLPPRYGRAWHHALWNPGFDEEIFLFRLCEVLVELQETNPRIGRLRRHAHDVLLSLVALRAGEQPDQVQFIITCSRPLGPGVAEVVFLSVPEP